jgi:trimeric autotransporter adhesin
MLTPAEKPKVTVPQTIHSVMKPILLPGTLLLGLFCTWTPALAQGTAFTYQGRLNDSGSAADGTYDFRFRLASDPLANNYVGGNVITNGAPVSGGLFTVSLDFGAGIFTGSNLWLEVDVRTNGAGAYTVLSPLQPLSPAPYAIMANGASNLLGVLPVAQLSGAIPSSQLSGTYGGALTFSNAANSFAGNGGGLMNVNAATLAGFAATDFWQAHGNAAANPTNGAFIGTTDNLPLELRVNNVTALRLEPNAAGVNVIGGINSIGSGISGVTISGGSDNSVQFGTGTVGTAGSFIGGGGDNLIGATIVGGNISLGGNDVIGGGFFNNIRAGCDFATIAGGKNNAINTNASEATIGGGDGNTATGTLATIPGGDSNVASTNAFAAGHRAKANHTGSFVWADSTGADFASTGTNQFLVRASGGVGIGTTAPEALFHVAQGSAGTVTANPGSIAVFEKSSSGYLSLLAPAASEIGVLFGNPDSNVDSGIIFNNSLVPHGLEFRTGTNLNRMVILANGNVGIGNTDPTNKLMVANARCDGSSWINASDRNLKENFVAIDPVAVLAKVAALPITRWNYKADTQSAHLGPVAQDFRAAFELGADDVSIATVDEGGVALAAIQGLNRKLEESRAETKRLEADNADLKSRLTVLEKAILDRKSN